MSAAKRPSKHLAPMRILVLMHEDLLPPRSIEGKSEREIIPFKTEFDVTTALEDMGHEVRPLGLANDLGVLRETLDSFRPKIAFNLLEEFHGIALYDYHVVSYLELMKRRYSGCNPRGLMLAHDKGLSKKVLSFHRIPVPEFAVFPLDRRFRVRRDLQYPLFVKSLTEEGSEGISQASVVHTEQQLRERVDFVHRQIGTDAIAERYIDGRELYVGVVGNVRLQTLPVWELHFKKLPPGAPRIATSKVKWSPEYQKEAGIDYGLATALTDDLERSIARTCKRAYRALNLSGYARVDLRLADDGRFYIIEVNPNPDLVYGGEFAESAEKAGLAYEDLLDKILRLGLGYRALWRE